MAAQDQGCRLVSQGLGHHLQQTARFLGEDRRAQFEHREVGIVHKIDTDPLGRAHYPHLPREVLELTALDQLLLDFVAQFLELFGVHLAAPATLDRAAGDATRNGDRARASLAHGIWIIIRIGYRATTQQSIRARTFLPHLYQRGGEVISDALALLLFRRAAHDTRTARRKRAAYERAAETLRGQLGREPSRAGLARLLEVGDAELLAIESASVTLTPITEEYDETSTAFASDDPDPFEALCAAEDRERLLRAMIELPDRLKLVLQLFFVEELNLTEIAAVLDVSVPRVHQLRAKALKDLRALMEGD